MLAGCATSRAPLREPVTRQIPPPPASLEVIPDPTQNPKKGQSAIYVAKVRGQIIARYKKIVTGAKKTWNDVRTDYSKAPAKR